MKKDILNHNSKEFLIDFKSVHEIMVFNNGDFFHLKKKEVLEAAKERKINYYITNKIFIVKRNVMVLS